MRKILVILAFLFTFSSPITLSAEEIKVGVNGMVCSFCAQGIKRTFSELPAVADVKVDLEKKSVEISTKENMELKDEEISALIKDSGYDVTKIERSKS